MRPRPDGAGPREWDSFCFWLESACLGDMDHYLFFWAAWKAGRHNMMVAAELRQQDLMKRNTELVEKNRVLEAQVQRLKTVLKEEL